MKRTYESPELYELKIDDVIAASQLNEENQGSGLDLNFGDLM